MKAVVINNNGLEKLLKLEKIYNVFKAEGVNRFKVKANRCVYCSGSILKFLVCNSCVERKCNTCPKNRKKGIK
jgi:hypothetical protein